MSKVTRKPCPFCGGDESHFTEIPDDDMREGLQPFCEVTCDYCCANAGCEIGHEAAVRAWNKRPKEEALEEIVSRLISPHVREKFERIRDEVRQNPTPLMRSARALSEFAESLKRDCENRIAEEKKS